MLARTWAYLGMLACLIGAKLRAGQKPTAERMVVRLNSQPMVSNACDPARVPLLPTRTLPVT